MSNSLYKVIKWMPLVLVGSAILFYLSFPTESVAISIGFTASVIYFFLFALNIMLIEKSNNRLATKGLALGGFALRLPLVMLFLVLATVFTSSNIRLVSLAFLVGHTVLFVLSQSRLAFARQAKEGV